MNYFQYLTKLGVLKEGVINDYLTVKDDHLFYKNVDLFLIADKYGSPLEVIYPAIIDERIEFIKNCFKQAFSSVDYSGKYIYAYSAKANYYEETLTRVLKNGCSLETTSEYDTRLVLYLIKKGLIDDSRLILCNGFKLPGYVKVIGQIRQLHKNIIPIIENEDEIQLLQELHGQLEVGLRLKTDLKATSARAFEKVYNRFGFYSDQLSRVADKISQNPRFKLTVFHVMIGSQIEDPDLYFKVMSQVIEQYCCLRKKYPTLRYLDIGGGMPVQYRLDFNFDYNDLISKLVKYIKLNCAKHHVEEPDIITEFGRYTVADYAAILFNVAYVKTIKNRLERWYIVNGSIMTMLPDAWALDQDFLVLPLNGYNQPIEKVWLAGITCDSDDVFHGSKSNKFLVLPKVKDKLYLGFFGCGAYQANISGIGGVHHCMLPEPSELIIDKIKDRLNFRVVTRRQSLNRILRILDYIK